MTAAAKKLLILNFCLSLCSAGARIKVMRHIDFGVPDRFRRQQNLDRDDPGFSSPSRSRPEDSDFGKAFGTMQVSSSLYVLLFPSLKARMLRHMSELMCLLALKL